MKKLPSDVLKFFKAQGAKGGRIGGKCSLETMTAEQARCKGEEGQQGGCRGQESEGQEGEGNSSQTRRGSQNCCEKADETRRRLNLVVHGLN